MYGVLFSSSSMYYTQLFTTFAIAVAAEVRNKTKLKQSEDFIN